MEVTLSHHHSADRSGEALLAVIAGSIAYYGGSRRGLLFQDLAALDNDSSKNQGAVPHLPKVRVLPSGANGRVSVEVSASATSPDSIDYVWVKDAASGEILGGRAFRPDDAPVLSILASPGQRLVPLVHSRADGTWEGATFVATL